MVVTAVQHGAHEPEMGTAERADKDQRAHNLHLGLEARLVEAISAWDFCAEETSLFGRLGTLDDVDHHDIHSNSEIG